MAREQALSRFKYVKPCILAMQFCLLSSENECQLAGRRTVLASHFFQERASLNSSTNLWERELERSFDCDESRTRARTLAADDLTVIEYTQDDVVSFDPSKLC
jgi:hypothetical protein